MDGDLIIRQMTRHEVDQLVAWAAEEGWNPGLHDAGLFWATDPEAFIAADQDGELVGGGAITSYGGEFGFMGFFIVRPSFRGHGLGDRIWHARLERLLGRLKPGASIGMDGVFDMQDYYARGGFVFSHRNLRFRYDVPGDTSSPDRSQKIVPLGEVPFERVLAYDSICFPAERGTFLEGWVAQPDALALGSCDGDGNLNGYGLIRRCGEGCKIGPLFADGAEIAEKLFLHLIPVGAGGPVYLDVPENNADAMAMARKYNMDEVFGCARMYLGPFPEIAHQRIFGVTTFELG